MSAGFVIFLFSMWLFAAVVLVVFSDILKHLPQIGQFIQTLIEAAIKWRDS